MCNRASEELFLGLLESARSRLNGLQALFRVAPQDFEDLVQETLLALWRKHRQIDNPEAWLLSALRLECLRYQRREIRRRETAVDTDGLERLAGSAGWSEADLGVRHDLRRLVRKLPARHRALIHLRFGLGLTLEEAAEQLGYRPASLKKTTTRCLHALRRKLRFSRLQETAPAAQCASELDK
jgi:RNA polymerase sigma-70 factor (ECF subfamily)